MEKMTRIHQISKQLNNSNHQNCMITSSNPQDNKGFFFFLLSYLTCSQIWQNYFLDDRHFDYMTKSSKKPCFKLSEAANRGGYSQDVLSWAGL